MEIILFQETYGEGISKLETRVNKFLRTGIEVCDIKVTTATIGDSGNMDTLTTIMIVYK